MIVLPLKSDLGPWIDLDTLLAIDADVSWQADELARCAEEPWYWAVNYVYTLRKDEFTVDAKPEVLRFPPLEHLRFLFHKCFVESYLAVDKSRQMTLSWLIMLYLLHITQFGQHEEIIIQTKKEVDADALVKRAEFMLGGQRPWMRPKYTSAFCRMRFPDLNCSMRGLPSGAGAGDQIRSANPSRYFLDEGGFVDEFEECRTAALACCRDVKLVSTANHGEWQEFINDKLEHV